jgi:protocatechuate 3,4-dioxygenase beta subunit
MYRLTLCLCFAALLAAQDFRAIITGRVSDTSGAAVANVNVTATNVDSGATTSSISGEGGNYTIAALPPGRYTLTAEFAGFKRFVREGLTLEVQARPQLDITLEAGDIQSTEETRLP